MPGEIQRRLDPPISRRTLQRSARLAGYAPNVTRWLGEPDPFRLRHRAALGAVVGDIVRAGLGRRESWAALQAFAAARLEGVDREVFVEMAESELLGLHDGNYARHRLRESEFDAWSERWRAER